MSHLLLKARGGAGGVVLLYNLCQYDCERDTTEHRQDPALPEASRQAAGPDEVHPPEWINWLPGYFQLFKWDLDSTTLDLNQLPDTSNSWSVTPRAEFLTHSYGIFFTLLSAQYQPHIFFV